MSVILSTSRKHTLHMVAASTASRHSWMGQETSWKNLNNLNRHFHMDDLDKMRRSCKVRLTFSWITTKCQAFQTLPMLVSTDPCVNNHWIRPRWYRGRCGVISKQLSFKLGTKIPYRTLVNSNWSRLRWRLFGYLIRRSGVWSSSIRRDCVFWHNEPRNTWRDGIRYFMTTNRNACATLQNQGLDYQNIEILCWMFFDEHKPPYFRTRHCFKH